MGTDVDSSEKDSDQDGKGHVEIRFPPNDDDKFRVHDGECLVQVQNKIDQAWKKLDRLPNILRTDVKVEDLRKKLEEADFPHEAIAIVIRQLRRIGADHLKKLLAAGRQFKLVWPAAVRSQQEEIFANQDVELLLSHIRMEMVCNASSHSKVKALSGSVPFFEPSRTSVLQIPNVTAKDLKEFYDGLGQVQQARFLLDWARKALSPVVWEHWVGTTPASKDQLHDALELLQSPPDLKRSIRDLKGYLGFLVKNICEPFFQMSGRAEHHLEEAAKAVLKKARAELQTVYNMGIAMAKQFGGAEKLPKLPSKRSANAQDTAQRARPQVTAPSCAPPSAPTAHAAPKDAALPSDTQLEVQEEGGQPPRQGLVSIGPDDLLDSEPSLAMGATPEREGEDEVDRDMDDVSQEDRSEAGAPVGPQADSGDERQQGDIRVQALEEEISRLNRENHRLERLNERQAKYIAFLEARQESQDQQELLKHLKLLEEKLRGQASNHILQEVQPEAARVVSGRAKPARPAKPAKPAKTKPLEAAVATYNEVANRMEISDVTKVMYTQSSHQIADMQKKGFPPEMIVHAQLLRNKRIVTFHQPHDADGSRWPSPSLRIQDIGRAPYLDVRLPWHCVCLGRHGRSFNLDKVRNVLSDFSVVTVEQGYSKGSYQSAYVAFKRVEEARKVLLQGDMLQKLMLHLDADIMPYNPGAAYLPL